MGMISFNSNKLFWRDSRRLATCDIWWPSGCPSQHPFVDICVEAREEGDIGWFPEESTSVHDHHPSCMLSAQLHGAVVRLCTGPNLRMRRRIQIYKL